MSVLTGGAVVLTCAMYLIRDNPSYLWAGLVLLAATAACGDLASVPYNAMLRQLSTPQTAGRVSSIGCGSGIPRQRPTAGADLPGIHLRERATVRGLLHVPTHDGLYVRTAMLLAAAYFAVLALPLLLVAHRLPDPGAVAHPTSMLGGYRRLWSEIRAEWRRDRNLVYFLGASALFRDGLAGVLAFGAVLGVNVYGISQADVLIFGVAASVVAAVGAVLGGFVDHRIGSKPVIVGSLVAIVGVALGHAGAVRSGGLLGAADCCWVCSSGRHCRRRGPCCCRWRTGVRRGSPSVCTR